MLPVNGVPELKLFQDLAVKQARFDSERMAIEWCDHVNGVTIFPKLPVYLRTHYESWKKNQRVRDAVEGKAAAVAALNAINASNTAELMLDVSPGADSDDGPMPPPPPLHHPPLVQLVTQHPPMAPYAGAMPEFNRTIGAMQVAFCGMPEGAGQKRGAGGRSKGSKDKKPRKGRTCAVCGVGTCPGKTSRDYCMNKI